MGTCWISQAKCHKEPSRVGNFETAFLGAAGDCVAKSSTGTRNQCQRVNAGSGAFDGATVELEVLNGFSSESIGAFPSAVPGNVSAVRVSVVTRTIWWFLTRGFV